MEEVEVASDFIRIDFYASKIVMTPRSVLKKTARWLGFFSGAAPRKSPRPAVRRIASNESLEDRRLLSAAAIFSSVGASSGQTALVAPLVTPAAASQGFVIALYQDVLMRAPDTSGLNYYTKLLTNGTPPSKIAAAFWQSAEHRGIEVDAFYERFFKRSADPIGRQDWITNMLRGMTEETVMADFLDSPEFQQLNPLPQPFVTALYNDVLGRAPDATGLSAFVTALTNHVTTPSQVVLSVINSYERNLDLVDSFYDNYLQRAPDAAGQAYWVQQLDEGLADEQSVAETFLSSQEYINLHPLF
jgi:hypothetical protein